MVFIKMPNDVIKAFGSAVRSALLDLGYSELRPGPYMAFYTGQNDHGPGLFIGYTLPDDAYSGAENHAAGVRLTREARSKGFGWDPVFFGLIDRESGEKVDAPHPEEFKELVERAAYGEYYLLAGALYALAKEQEYRFPQSRETILRAITCMVSALKVNFAPSMIKMVSQSLNNSLVKDIDAGGTINARQYQNAQEAFALLIRSAANKDISLVDSLSESQSEGLYILAEHIGQILVSFETQYNNTVTGKKQ